MLGKFSEDDDVIKALHSIMFGGLGSKGQRKKTLRKFNGFDSSTDVLQIESKILDNKKKWTIPLLKSALEIFGLEKSGARPELCSRIANYLMNPHVTKSASSVTSGGASSGVS
jgi:hypothetical protein